MCVHTAHGSVTGAKKFTLHNGGTGDNFGVKESVPESHPHLIKN